jgi:hypothetical protein
MKISSYYPTRDFAADAAPVTSDNANVAEQVERTMQYFFL